MLHLHANHQPSLLTTLYTTYNTLYYITKYLQTCLTTYLYGGNWGNWGKCKCCWIGRGGEGMLLSNQRANLHRQWLPHVAAVATNITSVAGRNNIT